MQTVKRLVLPPDNEEKILGLFVKDKSFYRTFLPLLAIVGLQHLAALMVNMVDNIMLGSYTELALSGATLVNQIHFVLQELCSGIGMGIVVLSAQYWGQKRIEPIKKIIGIGVKCAFLVGLIFFILSKICPVGLMSLFTNDPEVIAEGVKYLSVMGWTYLIFTISNSLMYSLQSVETAMIGTVMSVSTICINLVLNYILIFGHFGAREFGIVGAAYATLVSRFVELIIILIYVLFIDKKLHIKLMDLIKFDTTYLKDYFKISIPVILSAFLWGISMAAQSAVLGHVNQTTIAANSIAAVVANIFAVFGMANASVGSVVMGKTIGEKKFTKVRAYAKSMQGIFIAVGLLTSLMLFVFKEAVIDLYAVSPETRELALHFMLILCVTTMCSCYEYPCESGIIAGGGDTKYPAICDNLFMWCLSIPLACLSAFYFKFPPEITFCCLKVDQILKCIPNAIYTNRFTWARILTKNEDNIVSGDN